MAPDPNDPTTWRMIPDMPRRRTLRPGTNPRALGTNPRALRAIGIEPGTPEAKAHIEAVKLKAMKKRIGIK